MPRRQPLVTSAGAVVASLQPGATIGFGGLLGSSHPMPIVREIIRRGIGDLHVVGTAQGLEVDMLIAAGLVRRVSVATVSGDTLKMIAPAFRHAGQEGTIEVYETDEGLIYAALNAAAHRIDFMPWGAGMGTSFADLNEGMQVIESPFTGRPVMAVAAIPLDVAFLHAAAADVYGNVQHVGGSFGDRALARAADRVVVTVDRVVGNAVIRANPGATSLGGVHDVIYAPFGSHPFASPGHYFEDEPLLREYLAAVDSWTKSGDRVALDAYFASWVTGPADHWEYLDRVGARRLHALAEGLRMDDHDANEAM